MERKKYIYVCVFIVILISLGFIYYSVLHQPNIVNEGQLSLEGTDFRNSGMIELNGEWEFFWEEILFPKDFPSDKTPVFMNVPGSWYTDIEGNHYQNKGFATYRMVIEDIPNDMFFGLKKSNIRNASAIFINGKKYLEDGRVSTTLSESVPGNNPEMMYFELTSDTVEIIIHVSNHEYIVGGISKPLLFGLQQPLLTHQYQSITFEFAIILVVFIVGIFYTILFFTSKYYRMMEPATLMLALSCLCFGVMASMYSERILTIIFPDLTLTATFRIGHLLNALTVIFVLHTVYRINDKFLSKRLTWFLTSMFSIFILFVLIFPLEIYLSTLTFYMCFAVALFLLIWLRLVVLLFKSRDKNNDLTEHSLLSVAIFSVFLFWVDVLLYSTGITSNMSIAFFNMAVFSISLAALLIYRYTLYYKKSEELSNELLETLEVVTEKTNLVKENEIAFLQAQIKPHFLFNALNVISSIILTNQDKAYELVLSLSDYLRAKFDFYNKEKWISIHEEIELIESYVIIEKARFEERLSMFINIPEQVDFMVPPLLIQPLVENAIRHGVNKKKAGGVVSLSINCTGEGHILKVKDNGVGMSKETVALILSSNQTASNGIGLMNVQMRMQQLFGYGMEIQSEVGKGTTIIIHIPNQKG
ncbi:histidine kinase [Halolactibacillus miurensis]|uniref:histidine kinase n=1 Tax=Halolactibacillus miurensis TaxID=306541 RepID=A0A1I6NZK1_9BACI|nr:histidine kinase [Halolactibacillus miurensis]GEM04804.1 histidine kinase [Halolactibacillus miurensis]SFS33384.1 Histidine kinase-, DNA gyrase B-, and HSP90-like ATPase [Halolactibacillus miurensis]